MGQGFRKFRRRMLFASLWRSILPGISLALATFAVLLLLYKCMILPIAPLPAACIALGAGIVLAALLFVLLFPYKKRLARKLDRELAMREGVQTMLAFAHREDAMAQLQREQTDARLAATPTKKLRIRHLWTCVVCFVLAILLSVTAFAIPAKLPEPPPAPVDPPFELGEWETVALQNLIEEVRASTMTEPAKQQTVQALEGLLEALGTTKTQSRMKALVLDTVMSIRAFTDSVVTVRAMAPIFHESGSAYTRAFGQALQIEDENAFLQAIDALAASVCADEELDVAVHVLCEELRMALRNSSAGEDDALRGAIEALINSLTEIMDKAEIFSLPVLMERVTKTFGSLAPMMGKAMVQQRYDAEMGAYVEARLLEIFGLGAQDLPADENESDRGPMTPGDYKEDDDDQTISDGGLGSGELIVGSEDVIYDPVRDAYVKYSEVIDRYNAIFLESKIDGLLSDEAAELIEAYFTALFSPSNKEK